MTDHPTLTIPRLKTKSVTGLLEDWLGQLRRLERGHWTAERRYRRNRLLLGGPAAVLAAIAGTTILATIESDWNVGPIVAGVIALLAAILTALQTFLDYAGRADAHHASAVNFGALRHEAEELMTFWPPDLEQRAAQLRAKWNEANEKARPLPSRIYRQTASDRLPRKLARR